MRRSGISFAAHSFWALRKASPRQWVGSQAPHRPHRLSFLRRAANGFWFGSWSCFALGLWLGFGIRLRSWTTSPPGTTFHARKHTVALVASTKQGQNPTTGLGYGTSCSGHGRWRHNLPKCLRNIEPSQSLTHNKGQRETMEGHTTHVSHTDF